jgi:hypothetical protein
MAEQYMEANKNARSKMGQMINKMGPSAFKGREIVFKNLDLPLVFRNCSQ